MTEDQKALFAVAMFFFIVAVVVIRFFFYRFLARRAIRFATREVKKTWNE